MKTPTVGTAQKAVAKKLLCVFSANSSFQLALQLRIKLLLGQDLISSRTLRLFFAGGGVQLLQLLPGSQNLACCARIYFNLRHRILTEY